MKHVDRHLYKICASANLLGRIRFANPYDVSFSNNVDEDQRAGKVARRLIGALTNQLVLFPCNVGYVNIHIHCSISFMLNLNICSLIFNCSVFIGFLQ